MQKITIDEIRLIPPKGVGCDIALILHSAEKALSKLFDITGDLDILFHDGNEIGICCEGENNNAEVTPTEEWIGDRDCPYGMTQIPSYDADGLIDEDDIKKAVEKAFPNWDIIMEDVTIQTADEIYEEEMGHEQYDYSSYR